jgi:hypothetical protein
MSFWRHLGKAYFYLNLKEIYDKLNHLYFQYVFNMTNFHDNNLMTLPRNWRRVGIRRYERLDGVVVKWDETSPNPNPLNPNARMWTAWEPNPSQQYIKEYRGRRNYPKRWKLPQNAMAYMDKEFPFPTVNYV